MVAMVALLIMNEFAFQFYFQCRKLIYLPEFPHVVILTQVDLLQAHHPNTHLTSKTSHSDSRDVSVIGRHQSKRNPPPIHDNSQSSR